MMNLEKEIRQQPEVLSGIRAQNEAQLQKVITAAKAAGVNHLYFAARGTSDHACVYAQYLFGVKLGIPCTLGTPSVVSKYQAKLHFDRTTMVVGVSQSGRAADVMAVLEQARADGALTVSITNNTASPMAASADYHLYCAAGEERSIAATKTFTAQMYLLALLCGMWAEDSVFLDSLSHLPEYVGTLLESMPEKLDRVVSRYTDIEGGVILGRGMVYPIALEGALKILETNKLKMRGYPVSDFHHGPVAQLYPGDLAIVLAASGPVLDDAVEMIEKLQRIGADVLVVTDAPSVTEMTDNVLYLPETDNDFVSPFLFAITMQLFAQRLCLAKGIDPDKSDVLNKITITK